MAISCFSLSASLVLAYLWLRTSVRFPDQDLNLFLAQFMIGFKTFWTCGTLQRRPEVHHGGRVVDGQFTSSFVKRFVRSILVLRIGHSAESL